VGLKTDRKTDPDATDASEETTEQVASQTSEPEAIGDAETTNDIEDGAESTEDTSDDKEDVAESGDTSSVDAETEDVKDVKSLGVKRRISRIEWSRVVVFGVLPVLAMLIAAAAGYLKWQDWWARDSGVAGIESVAAAKDSTVAMLSYQPDTVDKDLGAARDRLTGKFKDSYTQLVHDVVMPGARKDHISAIATVPAAALVSATPNHAVALVFVNQTVTVGNDAPTDTASTVRVTLDKNGGRWLIASFDPV
jgi:Mce-associated membrane protein